MWGASKKTRQAKDTETKASMSLIAVLLQSKDARARKPQMVEAYLNLYYDEKIRPTIKGAEDVPKNKAMAAVAGDMGKSNKVPMITAIMNKARKMLKSESEEVKAMVEARWKEMITEREQDQAGKKNGATKGRQ